MVFGLRRTLQIQPEVHHMGRRTCLSLLAVLLLSLPLATRAQQPAATAQFALHDGDTVVFYGDSITEQRQYTSDVEMYTLTRFPGRKVRFLNAGVGGDKVSGGWAGPVDLRLERDVLNAHPTVLTIMLGMNDGYYRPFDKEILATYADGFRHILDTVQSGVPGVRITLLKPSPFDDVTRAPQWDPGYNSVMLHFGELMDQLATERKLSVADLNAPVTTVLAKAKQIDPVMASALALDRVHPGTAVHWVMAESILKSWGAPSIVSSASIDAAKGTVLLADNTTITQLQHGKAGLSWVELDNALPLPLAPVEVDPYLALALQASDLTEALNQQPLRVTGLAAGSYRLLIDEQEAGTFTADELDKGVNLALLETPMAEQARLVAFDNDRKNQIENMHFSQQNNVQDVNAQALTGKLKGALDAAFERERKDAQPVAHRYRVVANTVAH
jgi:lysophospholipase L1-like esterase